MNNYDEYQNGQDEMQGADLPVTNYANQPQPMDVELARASSGVASRAKHKPVSLPAIAPDGDDDSDSDDLRSESEGWLTIDVYQTPQEIVVESAVAGVNPEDLDITATTDSIAIKGERQRSKEVKNGDYLYQECWWGRFSRSIILPQEVDPESASVDFKNGILAIHLPKVNRKKSKKLKVK